MAFKRLLKLGGMFLLTIIVAIGCSGKNGSSGVPGATGPSGTPGVSTGSLSGTVVDIATQKPVANATIALNPAVVSTISSDTNGNFTFTSIPIGPYRVIVSVAGYGQFTSSFISVVAGATATTTCSLTASPASPPLVTWPGSYYVDALDTGVYNVGYGGTVNVTARVSDPRYPTSSLTYTWTVQSYPQYGMGTYPVETQIAGANTASLTFTTDPILTQLSPDTSRDNVMPIAPYEVGLYRLVVYVTNPAGAQTAAYAMVRSASKQPGLENVAVGLPVYLNFTEVTPDFTFTKPSGSSAALATVLATPPTTIVTFTPDVAGIYSITEATSGDSFTIAAGTWAGAYGPDGVFGNGTLGGAPCTLCHNDVTAPNKFPSVSQTPHANMFISGITGLLGDGTLGMTGYEPVDAAPYDNSPIDQTTNEVCLSCHTVGFDQAPVARGVHNNGFNDVMKTFGWMFPGVLQASNWTNMVGQYPTVAALANIQCDNCHGPSNSFAHGSSPDQLFERIGWGAGVCYQCHDNEGPEWSGSPHAYLALSVSEATIQNMGTTAADCGRCHAAQGFVSYLAQVSAYGFTGATNVLGFGTYGTTQLAGIGFTVSQIQPQTCQTCHDPHDASNPAQLRMYDTAMLAAGFTASAVGEGALCMQCHNTRNGLRNDSTGVPDYSAPHTSSQADILMGQNSYFSNITGTTTIYVSKHANIADTCVTCHMTLNNPQNGYGLQEAHTFTIAPEEKGAICKNCHGSGVDGSGLQTEVQGLLSALNTKLSNDVAAGINISGPTVYVSNIQTLVLPVTAATFASVRGQQGYQLWDNSGAVYTVALSSITTGTSTGYVFPLNGANPTATTIVEAGWNYSLVNSDGSLGIHNPTYVLTILNNTLNQLP